MNKLVLASTSKNAGKTSIVVGLAKCTAKKYGYMKPFGDRLLYRKKRLWDHDTALLANILHLEEKPEDMTIGFEHAKLKYMYDGEAVKEKILEAVSAVSKGKDAICLEGGRNLRYGVSVGLDAMSVARYLNARLVLVVSGDDHAILDDIYMSQACIDLKDIDFAGVIINKVKDVEDFRQTFLDEITMTGVSVLGIIPYRPELMYVPVTFLAERLFAKVIAGEEGLTRIVQNVFVGAVSASAARRNPLFKKENKLIITGGDRSDMIVAALESDTACVVLTNNILPSANIISKAQDAKIPLLLVARDTYNVAMQIDRLEPLLTEHDTGKIDLLEQLITHYVDTGSLM
jgi:hypothetical protein